MRQLINLWTTMLGKRPEDEQFTVWSALHTEEVIRLAIMKTAAKDLSLGKTMSPDYKVRFASKVMLTQTERNADHAMNRERLRQQFDGVESATRGSRECL